MGGTLKTYAILFFTLLTAPVFAQRKGDEKCIPADAAAKLLACPAQDTGEAALDAFATAACYETNPEELAAIRYRQGQLLYDAERLVEAAALFRHVAVEHSNTEVAVHAANLYLDSLNALAGASEDPFRACFDELAEAIELFADESQPPGSHLMRDAELRATVAAIRVQLERKRAEVAFSEKRYLEAAEIFLAIASDFPDWYDDVSRCHLLFNAAMALERSHRIGAAIAQYERMIAQYPSCELVGEASLLIGMHYQALQMHEQAADRFLELARRYPAEPEAPDALRNAINLLVATGQADRALQAVGSYERNYSRKHPRETATIVFEAGLTHVDHEDWKRVRAHYDSYLKRYSGARLVDEQIQAHVFIGDSYRLQSKPDLVKARRSYAQAAALFDKGSMNAVNENPRKAALLIAAAKARYLLALEKVDAFTAIALPLFKVKKRTPAKVRRWWMEKNPQTIWSDFEALSPFEDRGLLGRHFDEERDPSNALAGIMGERVGE